ncbi:tetratricopeptide repeat protein [Methanothermococcus sp.]|uniref:tetratricopeptide repeat protein n=1 Tax=Methanothermococcus sp. TaxID=2614238 RepID=UPI0025D2A916|nr:tetratricopeptide repeat protein [Methanothermococcus sp.]
MNNNTSKIIIGILCIIAASALAVNAYTSYTAKATAIKYTNEAIPIVTDAIANDNMTEYNEAEKLLNKAIKADPNYPWAWYNLANVYINQDHFHHYDKFPYHTYKQDGLEKETEYYNKGINAAKKFIELMPKAKSLGYVRIGDANYFYVDSYPDRKNKVLPYYLKVMNDTSSLKKYGGLGAVSTLYANTGRTYLAMGEFPEALYYYNKSANIVPEGPAYEHYIWSYIINAEFGNSDYKTANYYCHKFVDEYGPQKGWTMDLGHMPTAVSAYELGKYNEVIKQCKGVFSYDPESAYTGEAHRYIAMVDMKRGNKEDAIKHLMKNIEFSTTMTEDGGDNYPADLPVGHYERGLAYYYLGKYTGNKSYYEKALKDFKYLANYKNISDRTIAHENYYFLGTEMAAFTCAKLGDNKNAINYANMAVNELKTDKLQLVGWNKYFGSEAENIANLAKDGKLSNTALPSFLYQIEH